MIKQNNSSGVSIAIKNTLHPPIKTSLENLTEKNEFTIKVASSIEERKAVFHLGYRVYLDKGFIKKNSNQWLVRNYDFNDDTVILIVLDNQKKIAGSVTLVFDGSIQIPAEKLYSQELSSIKLSGKKTAELSRLVIEPTYRNSKEILNILFNYAAICIHRVKKYDGLVIQVNPHHKKFYTSLLGFQEIGGEKSSPQVQYAPSVLLYLSAKRYQSMLNRFTDAKNTERSLYQKFLKPDQEALVAYYLEKQIQPMAANFKFQFSYSELDFSNLIRV